VQMPAVGNPAFYETLRDCSSRIERVLEPFPPGSILSEMEKVDKLTWLIRATESVTVRFTQFYLDSPRSICFPFESDMRFHTIRSWLLCTGFPGRRETRKRRFFSCLQNMRCSGSLLLPSFSRLLPAVRFLLHHTIVLRLTMTRFAERPRFEIGTFKFLPQFSARIRPSPWPSRRRVVTSDLETPCARSANTKSI